MVVAMSDLNKRIATLEEAAPKTPITMKGLSDRLAQVEATAKKWEEATLTIGHNTSVSGRISLPLPQNIKNIYSGSKQMWVISGSVYWVESRDQTVVSASGGSASIDANNFYYQYNRNGAKAYNTITIRLVVYK